MGKNYVVVIGNLVKIIGPMTFEQAETLRDRLTDPFSEDFDPKSRWRDYTGEVCRLEDPENYEVPS